MSGRWEQERYGVSVILGLRASGPGGASVFWPQRERRWEGEGIEECMKFNWRKERESRRMLKNSQRARIRRRMVHTTCG